MGIKRINLCGAKKVKKEIVKEMLCAAYLRVAPTKHK
jgi:hypothetical protein